MSARQISIPTLLALFVAVVVATMPPTAQAQRPPVVPCADCWWVGPGNASLTHAEADVTVGDALYVTRWTLTFEHPGRGGLAEGRVIVPLPPDSVVTGLTLAGGEQTLEGELLDANDAARIYEEIVSRLIDPALLRSLGGDLYEIRAFPVPAGETRQVRYTVTTPLAAESSEVVIEAPWSRMSPRPASAAITAAIDVPWEVRTAIAPGHVPTIDRDGPGKLDASWESPTDWTAARDFRLHLAGGDGLVAARLLAHQEGDEDGYFALLLAPSLEAGTRVARDIVIVIDRSGSMYGEKIEQTRAAAVSILDDLGADDRFGVVSFADTATSFADAAERGVRHRRRQDVDRGCRGRGRHQHRRGAERGDGPPARRSPLDGGVPHGRSADRRHRGTLTASSRPRSRVPRTTCRSSPSASATTSTQCCSTR